MKKKHRRACINDNKVNLYIDCNIFNIQSAASRFAISHSHLYLFDESRYNLRQLAQFDRKKWERKRGYRRATTAGTIQSGVKAFTRSYASGIWKYDDNHTGEKRILRTMKNRKGDDRFWWPPFRRTLLPRMHERKSAGVTDRLAPRVPEYLI